MRKRVLELKFKNNLSEFREKDLSKTRTMKCDRKKKLLKTL